MNVSKKCDILYNEQRIIEQAAVIVTPNTVGGRLFACRLHYRGVRFMSKTPKLRVEYCIFVFCVILCKHDNTLGGILLWQKMIKKT